MSLILCIFTYSKSKKNQRKIESLYISNFKKKAGPVLVGFFVS